MADLPPDFPPGYALSGTSNHSRAYDLLLKEAGEIILRDASKLPLSPRRRTRRTKRRTPVRQRKPDLTAMAASAPTKSLLNAESFLANFTRGESDGTNPSFSSAPSSPSTSSDVSANQLISAAPANTTLEDASSRKRSDPSLSQPRGKGKEGTRTRPS
ncbi:hypothetical protein HPB50_015238 [Hyalomma asiaticum]|uniref:Uncharacterized protein n=1 Tax=Hyalomma asiaticum TaxID=266040 RepID=A0ACB7TKW0_HYAAI|nr:hypothetical protein HPB50_015238 [Hyalomma asiaticum]